MPARKKKSEGWWRHRPFVCLWPFVVALAATPAFAADIVIGVAAPLSGPQAAEGRALVDSVRWAVETINAAAPLDADRLTVAVEDDACEEETAAGAASRLVAVAPALVVGHPCGAAARAAARSYAAARTLFIATAPRHPDLTRQRAGPTVFRLAGRDDLQGTATARYLATAYPARRIAVVHDRTRYARTLADGVRTALTAQGISPVPEFGIVGGAREFSATVRGLRAHYTEVVYFAGFPSEAAVLWRQLRAAGAAPDLVGSDALANAGAELSELTGDAALRVRVVQPYSLADAPGTAPLRARLAAAGHAESIAAVAGHAAVEAWFAAVRSAGTRDVAVVAERLGGEGLPTIAGTVSFDRAGDVRLPSYAVTRLDDGRFKLEAVILPQPDNGGRNSASSPVATRQGRPPPLPIRHPLRKHAAPRAGTTGAR